MTVFNIRVWQANIDALHYRICQLVSWCSLLIVIITLLIVVLRYGFNAGWIAMQESVMYFHAMIFLLGSAYTLRVNEHVRVDIFYRQFSRYGKARVDFFGTLLLLMPVNFFILFTSWTYVANAWELLESSPQAGGLPLVFMLKSLILAFAVSMTLQGLAELVRNAVIMFDKEC
ncbi:MAG: TRAP-type mannitol/chloroaromatic compound transport system permease small subunit [Paraglaciecola sp.]|jgi:TRAP-type mannitol/chloroaromatic compound transport system permease small subunit